MRTIHQFPGQRVSIRQPFSIFVTFLFFGLLFAANAQGAPPPISDDNCISLPVSNSSTNSNKEVLVSSQLSYDELRQSMNDHDSIMQLPVAKDSDATYDWIRWSAEFDHALVYFWNFDGSASEIHSVVLTESMPLDSVKVHTSDGLVRSSSASEIQSRLLIDGPGSSPWSILCTTGAVVCETLVTTTETVRAHAEGTVEFWGLFTTLILASGTYASATGEANVDATIETKVDSRIECKGPSSQWTQHGGGGFGEIRRGHAYFMTNDVNGKYSECTYDNVQLTHFGLLNIQESCQTEVTTLTVDSLASVAKRMTTTPLCHQDRFANRPLDVREVPEHALTAVNPIQEYEHIGAGNDRFEIHMRDQSLTPIDRYRASVNYGETSICIDPISWPVVEA